jgi:hypothetical protein
VFEQIPPRVQFVYENVVIAPFADKGKEIFVENKMVWRDGVEGLTDISIVEHIESLEHHVAERVLFDYCKRLISISCSTTNLLQLAFNVREPPFGSELRLSGSTAFGIEVEEIARESIQIYLVAVFVCVGEKQYVASTTAGRTGT